MKAVRFMHHSASERPFIVIWEVTRACQPVCNHCRADALRRRNPFELTTDVGRKLLAERGHVGRGSRHTASDQRTVVVPHHDLGLPLDEVADVLGIPAGTVRSRQHHAMRSMRDYAGTSAANRTALQATVDSIQIQP